MKGKLIKTDEGFSLCIPHETTNEFIASTDGMYAEHKLSLKNCQAIERGYDLDELAYDFSWNHQSDPNYGDTINIFKSGFQKALEILGDKKFTERDVRGAYIQGTNDGAQFESMRDYDSEDDNEPWEFAEEAEKELTQSLQQTEWDVIVEMECVIGCQNLILNGENSVCCGDKKPKIADGCLILKRIDDE